MDDDVLPVRLPLTLAQFHQLPRNPAYKYEYLGGEAVLSPRPKYYHAVLDLRPPVPAEPLDLRPLVLEEIGQLAPLLSGAFRGLPPFAGLDDDPRQAAAARALERTRKGDDGPLVPSASFVARDGDRAIGMMCVTLLPDGDPTDWDSYYWREPPPADLVERRGGRPHLTWVCVSPPLAGRGIGTGLLAAAVRGLLDLGYAQLHSTFVLGNDSSLLWHWRNGFRLLPYPGSYRLMQERWKAYRG
jgi:GNAT superfamily N-acetyltransferase